MMKRFRYPIKLFSFGLLLGIAVLTLMLTSYFNKNTSYNNFLKKEQPDAFIEEVNAIFLDEQGNPKLQINAPQMIHYAENNLTHILKPRILLYRQSPKPWHIEADYARTFEGLSKIKLVHHVRIFHIGDVATAKTELKTNSLYIFPKTKLAKTDDNVVIKQPNLLVHGKGMRANLDDGSIKILQNAQGEYAPN